jgi:peptide deformylase
MSIKTYGAPILRSKTKPVTEFNEELAKTVEQMKKTMQEANGVGLSANQVGINKALFIVKLGEEVYAFVNPELVPLSNEKENTEEGCLSIPGVWVDVERYLKVRLRAQNLEGETIEIELEGYLARVVQHEVDHLAGVLIIDRIGPDERRRIAEQLEEIKNKVS